VEGLATDGQLDHDQEIIDPGWAAKAFAEFFASGPNIRQAHDSRRPIGLGVEWRHDDRGVWVKSRIVDRDAQKLVRAQVLRAYSVGVAYPVRHPDPVAKGGRIVSGSLIELSLVDRPSNSRCGVRIAEKSADGVSRYVGQAWTAPDKSLTDRIDKCQRKAGKWLAREARLWAERDEVNKAHQALYDDPAAMQAWLAKRASEALAGDDVTAAFLGSCDPRLKALAEAGLRGG
jgi:hypothetical protein